MEMLNTIYTTQAVLTNYVLVYYYRAIASAREKEVLSSLKSRQTVNRPFLPLVKI